MIRLFILLIFSLSVSAQLRQTAAISVLLPEDLEEDITVIPVRDNAVLMISSSEEIYKRKKNISISKYNQDLMADWVSSFTINKPFVPVNYLVKEDILYYLLAEPDSKKIEVVTFQLETGHWKVQDLETLTQLYNINFDIFNGNILVMGEYNARPVVEMHSLSDKKAKVLPEIYAKNIELTGLKVNPYRNELYVFTLIKNKCQLQFLTYDADGKIVSRGILGDKKHKIKTAEVNFSSDGEPHIVGAFNSSCQDMVQGFYSGSLDRPNVLHYNSISDLESFNEMLSPKRREKRRMRKQEGKVNDIKQRAIFTVPFSGSSGFVASAEIYSQQSMSSNMVRYSMLPNEVRRRPETIYEYKIHRLLLAEVGFDGQVSQDNIVKIESNAFRNLRPHSAYLFKDNNFYGFLSNSNDLLYVDMGERNAKPKKFSLIDGIPGKVTNLEADVVGWTSKAVLAHGVAYIQTGSEGFINSRQIYFIKKIELN